MRWLCCNIDAFSQADLQQARAKLSPSRREYIDRLKHKQDQDRSLAAELLLQQLLHRMDIDTAVLHRKENGQPYLTGCDLQVSISHSHSKVACAVSRSPVGIDIERMDPIKLQMCRHVCTPEEKAYVLSGTSEDVFCQDPAVLQRFYEVWTAKEAWFKKLGTGITGLKSVNILPMPRQFHTIDGYMVQIL